MGRAGFMFGMQCPENGNTAYLRTSAVHEFLGDNAVTGGNGTVYEIDGKDHVGLNTVLAPTSI